MSEESIMIPEENFALEARYAPGDGSRTAIICHPHPLYGGTMDNNVVCALQSVLAEGGWGTLRFNFRGAGGSGGRFGGGDGEADDILAVAAYLAEQEAGEIHLAGYSFGSWIGLKAVGKGLKPASAILVSPPLDFLDFANLDLPPGPCLVTAGDRDSFCAERSLREWLAPRTEGKKDLSVEILPGCDHFYWNREELLSAKVKEFLQTHLRSHTAE